MSFYEGLKPYASFWVTASQFLGRPFCTRVITPALVCSVSIVFAFAIGSVFLSLFEAPPQEQPLFTFGDLTLLYALLVVATSLIFWGLSHSLYSPFLRFVLVWTQRRNCSESKPIATILEFIKSPDSLVNRIEERRVSLERRQRELELKCYALAEERDRENQNIKKLRRMKEGGVGRLIGLIVATFRKWSTILKLSAAQLERSRFAQIQASKTRAKDASKALNDAKRAIEHISTLVSEIDKLAKEAPLAQAGVGFEKEILDQIANLHLIVQEVRRWRKRLIQALLTVDELLGHCTLAEIPPIEQSFGFKYLTERPSKALTGDRLPTYRDILAVTDVLRKTTLAEGILSPSSEDYWSDRLAEVSTHKTLPLPLMESIVAADRSRSEAVSYATIVMALILAGPCIVLAGTILSEELRCLWLALAAGLLALCIWPWRWAIWMAVIVAIRERQIRDQISSEPEPPRW